MNNILEIPSSVNSVSSVSSVFKNSPSEKLAGEELPEVLEQLALQTEHAQTLAQDSPDIFIKAAMNIAAMNFFTVLNRFDTVSLSKRLKQKPELYFQLINSQANLMRANLERQKFEFRKKQAEAKQRQHQQKLCTRKPILITENTLASLKETLTCSRRREEPHIPVSHAPGTNIKHPEPCTANTGASHFVTVTAVERNHSVDQREFDHAGWRDTVPEHTDELACSAG